MKKLSDVSDWMNGKGIMAVLTANHAVPWAGTINGQILDYDYYGNRSGNKVLSNLAENFVSNDSISDSNMETLANIIYAKFNSDWLKAYEAINSDYNPIDNYSMIETETPSKTKETIIPAEITETTRPAETTEIETPAETTETITPAEVTETETPAGITVTERPAEQTQIERPAEQTQTERPAETTTTGNNEDKIAGFNSASYSNANKNDNENTFTVQTPGTSSNVVNNAGTSSNVVDTAGTSKTIIDTAGTVKHTTDSDEITKHTTDTAGTIKHTTDTAGTFKKETDSPETREWEALTNRQLTRKGNIGVTTSQQMIESEINLRKNYNFFNSIVYPAVDEVMTFNIFHSDIKNILY